MANYIKSPILAVNGKKSQLVISNGRAYFGSHTSDWGQTPQALGVKSGWGWKYLADLGTTDKTEINDLQTWANLISEAIGKPVTSIEVRENPAPRPKPAPATDGQAATDDQPTPAPVPTPQEQEQENQPTPATDDRPTDGQPATDDQPTPAPVPTLDPNY